MCLESFQPPARRVREVLAELAAEAFYLCGCVPCKNENTPPASRRRGSVLRGMAVWPGCLYGVCSLPHNIRTGKAL
ncbi:hypothetical protein CNY67_05175 [Desulfovibrio sp. G11]|nr:hypothetical protein CNY67_05175 [Desulfovibrio sp. G11]